jgi:glycosyltransferase involved in cell wall biosynthesis
MGKKEEVIVSIITPLYNEIDFIQKTAESVINQSCADWEWIIVDDGSTDGSYEISRRISSSHSKIRLLKRPKEKPKGPSSCRNYAVEKSKGRYLIFLDADDLLTQDCIENRLQIAEEYSFELLVFKMAYLRRGTIAEVVNNSKWSNNPIRGFLRYDTPWPVTAVLWERNAFLKLKFDEDLQRLTDYDLHLNALHQKLIVRIVEKSYIDCLYRVGKSHRWNDQDFILVVASSFVHFFSKWAKEISELEDSLKNDFELFIIETVKRINKIKNFQNRQLLGSKFIQELDKSKPCQSWFLCIVIKLYLSRNNIFVRKILSYFFSFFFVNKT